MHRSVPRWVLALLTVWVPLRQDTVDLQPPLSVVHRVVLQMYRHPRLVLVTMATMDTPLGLVDRVVTQVGTPEAVFPRMVHLQAVVAVGILLAALVACLLMVLAVLVARLLMALADQEVDILMAMVRVVETATLVVTTDPDVEALQAILQTLLQVPQEVIFGLIGNLPT